MQEPMRNLEMYKESQRKETVTKKMKMEPIAN